MTRWSKPGWPSHPVGCFRYAVLEPVVLPKCAAPEFSGSIKAPAQPEPEPAPQPERGRYLWLDEPAVPEPTKPAPNGNTILPADERVTATTFTRLDPEADDHAVTVIQNGRPL